MLKKSSLLLIIILFLTTLTGMAQQSLLRAGPMLGHTEMKEVNLWLQTTEPAQVTLQYWKEGEGRQKKGQPQFRGNTSESESNIVQVTFSDLDFGTTYRYEIKINGKKVSFPYDLTFTTQPLWQWRTDPPNVHIAMGSCLYINDPVDDRPGEPYGQSPDILTSIAEKNPDIMLWMGDNVYYREPDFYTPAQMDLRYRDARDTPEMQKLLATAVNIAAWDDHDYGPNNADRSYRMREEALDIFRRYWANPGYGIEGTKGIFTRYKYSDLEFFIMDDRYHRAPNELEDPDKDFFGERQLQWLMDGLAGSNATFKLVVVGNQATNRMNRHEALVHFEREYEKLMKFLDSHEISGVVFLSGDRHFSELLKTEREDRYPIYEFTSSPLSAGTFDRIDETDEFHNPQRIDGTLVNTQNFGMVRVDGKRGERRLTLQTYDASGKKLWEYVIKQEELED